MNATSRNTDAYKNTLPVQLLCTRNDDGASCYFVVRSNKSRSLNLLAKRSREQVNISEYGEILASGYGNYPNAHTVAMLKARHNIDFPPSDAH